MIKPVLLSVLAVVACGVTNAASLYVSANGTFSSSDTAGTLVAPNKQFNIQFTIDSNLTPLSGTVTSLGFDAPFSGFMYSLGGTAVSAIPSEIRFSTTANGGLFDIIFGTGLGADEFDFQGTQMFSGTTAAPTFPIKAYAVSSLTYSDPVNYDVQTPAGQPVTVAATPEPSAISLFFCGGLLLLTVRRQRLFGSAKRGLGHNQI